jgi:hypothetical protein
MKRLIFLTASFLFAVILKAQTQPATSGTVYGKVSDNDKILIVDKLESALKENKYEGKITGKVAEVCLAEGCWIKIQEADGSTMMVRAKNHSFVMPPDIVGKTVVAEGDAEVKEISEAQRRHYAEDAGKSQKEIKKIKGAEKQIVFMAWGVKVM